MRGDSRQRCGTRAQRSKRRPVLRNEAAIDAILPGPYPSTGDCERAVGRDRLTATCGDQCQRTALRNETYQCLATKRAAQIRGEWRALAHREHARFRSRVSVLT